MWSSSTYAVGVREVVSFYSRSDGLSPLFLTYRGNSFTVRCVQAFIRSIKESGVLLNRSFAVAWLVNSDNLLAIVLLVQCFR